MVVKVTAREQSSRHERKKTAGIRSVAVKAWEEAASESYSWSVFFVSRYYIILIYLYISDLFGKKCEKTCILVRVLFFRELNIVLIFVTTQ